MEKLGVYTIAEKRSKRKPEKEHVPGVSEKEQREYGHIKESELFR